MKVLSSDILRGNVDTFILNVLQDGRMYGAQIRKKIEDKTKGLYVPNEQTMYSAFHRLEDDGLIVGLWGDEKAGVTRKYYEITQDGIKCYLINRDEWRNSKRLLDLLID